MHKPIPIFFACNDRYVPYLDVAIISLISHASPDREYRITVLKTDMIELKAADSNFMKNFLEPPNKPCLLFVK